MIVNIFAAEVFRVSCCIKEMELMEKNRKKVWVVLRKSLLY